MSLDYRNIGKLFSLNILNVALSVAYSTLMVYTFGTSLQVEAFFAASVLGTTVSRFVQTGQLVEIIVPKYHRVKSEVSSKAAMSIISMMCNYMAGTALLLVVLLISGGTLVVDWLVPGFQAIAREQVYQIFCITGFLMPIQIATNLFQGMLNAENIYGKVELTNTISLATNLLILIIWGHTGNVMVLVIGLVLSVVMQFLTTAYYLRRVGYRHTLNWRSPYFTFKEMWRAISAATFYMGGVQIYTFVFNAALSFLPAGLFAIYRYVEVIYGKVANIFMIPISTVFFNEINRFLVQKNEGQIKGFIAKNLNLSYLIGFLVLLPFWVGGQFFIWTLWGGTKFDANAVEHVYQLLCVFFFIMLLSGPYMIYRKLAVSVTRPDLQYYFWGIVHVISSGFSYFLIYNWGFNGLLVQVFVHTFITTIVPFLTVYFLKREYFSLYTWKEVSKITTALGISAVVGWGLKQYAIDFRALNKLESLWQGTWQAVLTLVVFGLCCYILKVEEIEILKNKLHGILSQRSISKKSPHF